MGYSPSPAWREYSTDLNGLAPQPVSGFRGCFAFVMSRKKMPGPTPAALPERTIWDAMSRPSRLTTKFEHLQPG